MTTPRDPDRLIRSFLLEGDEHLHDRVYDAVRADIDHRRQRVVIGPWRMPDIMNKLVPLGLGAAAVVVALIIGTRLLGFPDSGGVGASPTPVGGTVEYISDGAPSTTEVDGVADGSSVSGTAVSSSTYGTHTVQLECAARDGDTWAFGGTTEETTVPGERAGDWSAVVVRDGSPQMIAIWLSDSKVEGIDCDGWLGAMDMATVDASVFNPVQSGELVPPPDLAP